MNLVLHKSLSMKKVVLITGASSGMGLETAVYLNNMGYKVYAAARRIERMKEFKKLGIIALYLDLTEEESIRRLVDSVFNADGRIDILINCAGYGLYGSLEDVSLNEAKKQMEVNVFGTARLTQLVVPVMRKQKDGKIVNVSSIGGKLVGPFGLWYHVSKFGLEALSDALRIEVKPFGIDVVIIQPGGIQTEWGDIAMGNLVKSSQESAYQGAILKVVESNRQHQRNYSSPSIIAKLIFKAVRAKKPKIRYHAGYMAGFLLFIRKVVPDKIIDKMISKEMAKK